MVQYIFVEVEMPSFHTHSYLTVSSTYGRGIVAEYAPSLSLSNSKFILFRTQFGGACGFHGRKSQFSVSNRFYVNNHPNHSLPEEGTAA